MLDSRNIQLVHVQPLDKNKCHIVTVKETPQIERPAQNTGKKMNSSLIDIHTLSLTKRPANEEAARMEVSMYIHWSAES